MVYQQSNNRRATVGCLATTLAISVLFALILVWMDTSVVYDPHDRVRSAYFAYGNGERDYLTQLPWGTWVGWVGGDGLLQIECMDGTKPAGTYVSGMFGAEATVSADCEVRYDF